MADKKPNILVIWGDDIGITNLSCYSDGLMGYRTPNIDRVAEEGARFTDSYGEQSCTAGRAAFIAGQNPHRTGLTKVGMPGAEVGLQDEDPTIATALKEQGYVTGQFGKNHFGDLDKFLPANHGFDEFFGNLYHLNAEEEPEQPDYPPRGGLPQLTEFDPFLLLDDFRNDPDDYLAGFPWHPHRGIETVTYVLAGTVDHGDSLGNRGSLGAGDVQWMTAGSGILHQEMPQGDPRGRMHGFQLWANLPAKHKMTAPRYQDVFAGDTPDVTDDDGTHARVICGSFWGERGPVDGIAADPHYLDVWVPPGQRKTIPVETFHHAFAYVFEGGGSFRGASDPRVAPTGHVGDVVPELPPDVSNRSLVLFDRGDGVTVDAGEEGIRFLLVSGRPLEEPVAWYGPIVMNTNDELRQAQADLQSGTFIKE